MKCKNTVFYYEAKIEEIIYFLFSKLNECYKSPHLSQPLSNVIKGQKCRFRWLENTKFYQCMTCLQSVKTQHVII